MKKLFATILFFGSLNASAATTQISVEYEVVSVKASCRAVEKDGRSFFQIRLDKDSFDRVRELGFKKTRYAKHPNEICSSGDLPMEGNGFGDIDILVYTLDLDSLNQLL